MKGRRWRRAKQRALTTRNRYSRSAIIAQDISAYRHDAGHNCIPTRCRPSLYIDTMQAITVYRHDAGHNCIPTRCRPSLYTDTMQAITVYRHFSCLGTAVTMQAITIKPSKIGLCNYTGHNYKAMLNRTVWSRGRLGRSALAAMQTVAAGMARKPASSRQRSRLITNMS